MCRSREVFGGEPTVDLFASAANARRRRFWSWRATNGAEGVDAFTAPSWARRAECECGMECRELLWCFPPVPVLHRFWARAQSERARGLAVVPYMPGAVWWPVMLGGSVGGRGVERLAEGKRAFDVPAAVLAEEMVDPRTRSSWSLFCFDFARPAEADRVCAQAAEVRVKQSTESQRLRLREEQQEVLQWSANFFAQAEEGGRSAGQQQKEC